MATDETRRIQVVGPVGSGKTFLFNALSVCIMTSREREFDYVADTASAVRQQRMGVFGASVRTPEGDPEVFKFTHGTNTYELVSTPGEWVSRALEGEEEGLSLDEAIDEIRNDLCVITVNPFKVCREFGHLVFVALVVKLQEQMPEMTLGEACRTASISIFDLLWDTFDEKLGDRRWTALFSDGGLHEQVVLKAKTETASLDDAIEGTLPDHFELVRRDGTPLTDKDSKTIHQFLGEAARIASLQSGRDHMRAIRIARNLTYEPIFFLCRMDLADLVDDIVFIDLMTVYKHLFPNVAINFSNIYDSPIVRPEIFATVPDEEEPGRIRVDLEPALVRPIVNRLLEFADEGPTRANVQERVLNARQSDILARQQELDERERQLEEETERRIAEYRKRAKYAEAQLHLANDEVEVMSHERYAEGLHTGKRIHFRGRTIPAILIATLTVITLWIWYYFGKCT